MPEKETAERARPAKLEQHGKPGLPGAVETVNGKRVQEGYGEWPTCQTCNKQVDPTQWNNHTRDHENEMRFYAESQNP